MNRFAFRRTFSIVPLVQRRSFVSTFIRNQGLSFVNPSDATKDANNDGDLLQVATKRLESAGFSHQKAATLAFLLQNAASQTLTEIGEQVGSREKQEEITFQQKKLFIQLRKYLEGLENEQFSTIREKTEQLKTDTNNVQSMARERAKKALAEIRLDLNLEKGRMKDSVTSRTNSVQEITDQMDFEIQQLNAELASLKKQTTEWLRKALKWFLPQPKSKNAKSK
ncbi:DUF1640 family protein [Schizosaccharomyces japonicus yFS275]|uniref:DUF1640 family protein n=1 Tax=Schizosaccharomyces japonicus (strain yFS275 / FY16936) TaxID=402676 RepID=B6K446_SCHJY|nr:DUF1640 family protein [Schizosaccharomyces japonicus yFS275]EEB08253.1 DUF1640 family protein [Schizosaccharomyces japonicus yFS275]